MGLWLNRIDQRSANYGSTYYEGKGKTVFEHQGESKSVTIKGTGLISVTHPDKRNDLFITEHEHLVRHYEVI
jgi:hypothetical protein